MVDLSSLFPHPGITAELERVHAKLEELEEENRKLKEGVLALAGQQGGMAAFIDGGDSRDADSSYEEARTVFEESFFNRK